MIVISNRSVARAIDRNTTRLIEALHECTDKLIRAFKRPPMPGLVSVTIESEVGDMLNFKLVLPAPGAADVVSRELTVAIGAGEPVTSQLAGTATEVGGLSGNDNDAVAVSLVDIDDAGNRSEARSQTFTLTDTLAPPQPGEIGLVIESET